MDIEIVIGSILGLLTVLLGWIKSDTHQTRKTAGKALGMTQRLDERVTDLEDSAKEDRPRLHTLWHERQSTKANGAKNA